MAKKVKIKHEWHIYSITAFVVAMFIFIVTSYNGNEMAIALALLAFLTTPFYSSDAWKILSPQTHKSLFILSLLFIFGWVVRLIYINKILPRYRNNGVYH